MWLPEKDRFFVTKGHMLDNIKHLLGGRVAEELKLDDISTGASNDLERATGIARSMVTEYGFSDAIGPVCLSSDDEVFLGRDFSKTQNYSEEVASKVDSEIRRILEECYAETRRILTENDEAFERVARALLLVETLDGEQFEKLFTGEVSPEELAKQVKEREEELRKANEEEKREAERLEEERRKELAEKVQKLQESMMAEAAKNSSSDKAEEFEVYVRPSQKRNGEESNGDDGSDDKNS